MTTHTLTYTYCKFCEALASMGRKIIAITESAGYARAAAELARQGYLEEAKELMLQLEQKKKGIAPKGLE